MLSIIIPSFNEGERLAICIKHVIDVAPGAEIIVVDAGIDSSKVRADILTQPGIRLKLITDTAVGRAVQMNRGAMEATGNYLLFLHCDTWLPTGSVDAVSDILRDNAWGRFDVCLDAEGWQFQMVSLLMNLRSRLTDIATGDQCLFMRREFFEEIGSFSEIPLMEDIEFSKRAKLVSKPARVTLKVVTSARRWQQNGVWKTIFLMWKLRFLYWMGDSPVRLAGMYRNAR